MADEPRVRIGVLARAFGLAGEIRCVVDAETAPQVAAPCDAWVGYSASFMEAAYLERCETRGNELICAFRGVTDRSGAERLLDRALFLPRTVINYSNPLSDPEFIGYRAVSESGEDLGVIDGVFRTPAHVVWQLTSARGEHMVPAISQFVVEVLHDERRVILRTIPGLFDDEGITDAADD